MPTLRIKLPDHKGEITHVLSGARITVGRRPENTIQIIDRTVSAHHAEFISVNGHYRLHDLGSTNLTCVDDQPITDFHLHSKCRINFGTVECQFSLEQPGREEASSEIVPTRAELEYLRRENLDHLAKISALQKQMDILSSARLVTSETTQLGIPPIVHRRISMERDELRAANANLQMEVQNLKEDISGLTKAREAMRVAWQTVKGELAAAQEQLAARGDKPSPAAPAAPAADTSPAPADRAASEPATDSTPVPAAPASDPGTPAPAPPPAPARSGAAHPHDDHRALATVVMSGPALLNAIDESLGKLSAGSDDAALRGALAAAIAKLNRHASPLDGHPVQRIVASMQALVQRDESAALPRSAIRSLQQAAGLLSKLLDPAQLKRARSFPMPSALVVDDDPDVIATVTRALSEAGIAASSCPDSGEALERLSGTPFDLILLDVALPGMDGIAMCASIRELESNKRSPVIFLTASDTVETRAQSSLSGGSDFIGKPFSADELALKAGTWALRNQFGVS